MMTSIISDKIKIVNVVVSTKFNSKINIEKIAKTLPKSIYEPEIFSGLIHRRINPASTMIMFSSGRITSVGTKNEKDGKNNIWSTLFDIEKIMNVSIKPTKFSTVNVVAMLSLNETYNLEKFNKLSNKSKFDQKVFSGLIFTPKKGRCLIFSSGKILSVGCKSEKSAKNSILEAHQFLKKVRCVL